jgi:SNF2 family DNA or RNA helicase
LGQKRPVTAYRLIMRDSIEEKIEALKEKKRGLVRDLFDDDAFSATLTVEDFKDLFG